MIHNTLLGILHIHIPYAVYMCLGRKKHKCNVNSVHNGSLHLSVECIQSTYCVLPKNTKKPTTKEVCQHVLMEEKCQGRLKYPIHFKIQIRGCLRLHLWLQKICDFPSVHCEYSVYRSQHWGLTANNGRK